MAVSGPYRSSFDEILILDLYNLVLYKLNCIRKYLKKIKKNIVYIQKKVQKAIATVAKRAGISSVVDSSAMLYGGKDLTSDVIAEVAK